ncbi:small ribosomal subunit protein mL103 (rPPR7)-like [Cornus florida]|uniref:small ribosomal subunit protein mL103 (rPPR7)-like n=1 Tax=Cornus florida TaxID=4283 RepID=UPI00289BB63C|nr:small ribosomal subunit protein mL103 (rPPR7)-like [Cornus florida]
MSSSLAIRHVRHLSTTAAAATDAATATDAAAISISKAIAKLKTEFDPDKALEIYSSVSRHYTSPLSTRFIQEFTVKRLAKSHRFSDIETLIESHKNDPKITQEPYLSTLIRSYGIAGMFDHSLKTYNQMEELGTPRTTTSFNALLAACNQSKLFDQVPQLFEEMPQKFGFSPDKVSYGILVKSYCHSGSTDLAISRMKEMEEKGIEITAITFTTILHSLYKEGKSDEAERIWNEMMERGCSPDIAAYNVRIMHVHGGEPETVKGLIEDISNAGLKPDTITYNYLMTCYYKHGKLEEAEKVYQGMKGNGCHRNVSTFRILIYYLCKNGNHEKGYEVFKDSVKFHKVPDFNTLKPLVQGLVKKSKRKEAEDLIRTMKKKFPSNRLNAWKRLVEDLGLAAADSSGENQEEGGKRVGEETAKEEGRRVDSEYEGVPF